MKAVFPRRQKKTSRSSDRPEAGGGTGGWGRPKGQGSWRPEDMSLWSLWVTPRDRSRD